MKQQKYVYECYLKIKKLISNIFPIINKLTKNKDFFIFNIKNIIKNKFITIF